jgi:hypothetical protein
MKKLITLLLVLTGMVSTAMAATATIYVKSGGSGAPNIWLWGDGVTNPTSTWPGEQMTTATVNGITVYKYDVTYTGENYSFLLNYNGNEKKSNDVTTSGTVYYYWDGNNSSTPSYRGINQVVSGSRQITAGNVEWDTSSSDNKMTTTDDETFTLTVTGRVLKGGETYSYKICADGGRAWVPNDNKTLSVTEDGVYDITYTYVRSPFNVTAVATKKSAATVSYKYYVWDDDMKISGKAWENNEMSVSEGTASLTVNNRNLTPGTYNYKIVEQLYNGSSLVYTYNFDQNSYAPTLTRCYNVTFSFNISSEIATCSGTAVTTGYYVMYDNGSGWYVGNHMKESSGVHTGTITGLKKDQFFAILPAGNLPGSETTVSNWDNVVRPVADVNVSVTWNTNSGNTTTNNNGRVWTNGINDTAITLEITYDSGNSTWSVVPYFEREIKAAANNYATFSSDKAVAIPENVTAKYANSVTSGTINWTEFQYGIPANTGALLHATEAGVYKFTPATTTDEVTGNLMVPIAEKIQLAQSTESGKTNFILSKVADVLGFYKVNTSRSWCAAGTAYLKVANENIPAPVSSRGFFALDDETTGIEAVNNVSTESANDAREYYNLNGQRVMNPSKGLYIVNGKKVIIK